MLLHGLHEYARKNRILKRCARTMHSGIKKEQIVEKGFKTNGERKGKLLNLNFTTRKNVNAKYKTYKIQFVNQSRS